MKQFPILFIVGSTAVGKSEVGLLLAERFSGEIISCDAMQVYKEIAVASDKPDAASCKRIKHHGLDLVSVTEEFNVGSWRDMALKAIEDIRSRGKNVIFCGGSGMYMTVMLDGIFEQISRNPVLREKLQKQAVVQGIGTLHRRLAELDPEVAGKIHPNDAKRIIRALEVCMTAGASMSQMQSERQGLWGEIPVRIFGLNRQREILYKRVEDRVDAMFECGLIEEIQKISQLPLSTTSRTLIGIREAGGYLDGQHDLTQAKYLMKMNTRHFVKKQLTWFRREKRLEWINIENETSGQIVDSIVKNLERT